MVHSGAKALGIVGSAVGVNAAAAGNLLARAEVPGVMVAAFEAERPVHFAARLLQALLAGVEAGGEAGPYPLRRASRRARCKLAYRGSSG